MKFERKDKRQNKGESVREGYKVVTLETLYKHYPHRTPGNANPNTVPVPYIPKDQISTHEWALTYKDWLKVVKCYFKWLVRYLVQGYSYTVPQGFGTFTLEKKRVATRNYLAPVVRENIAKGIKAPYPKQYNRTIDGYLLGLKWDRNTRSSLRFSFKKYYNIALLREINSGIIKACTANRGILYRFRNSDNHE